MYLHEMEAGKPKPALAEDVAKLEARAKSNPSLRPPPKPPPKITISGRSASGKDVKCPDREFDFAVYYYDCQEEIPVVDESFMIVENLLNCVTKFLTLGI